MIGITLGDMTAIDITPGHMDLILPMCHRVPQVCHSHFSTKRPTDVSHIVEAHGCVTPDICVFAQ